MDTNKQKEKNQLPLLTPKNPDGSQRIIKQIMVIDPNKLRVAGLDLKMAEALRKSKGQQTQTSHAPVGEAISRAQKVELAKALNKKKKQAPALKEPPKTLTDAIRKLPFLHTSPASAVDPQVKIPTAPITHSPLKTHTVMLNFLKGNQKSSTIEVNVGSPKSGATKEDVEHPKASLKPSQAVTIKPEIPPEICKTVKTIESKIISPEVQFELKKRPPPAAAKEQKTALRVIKVPVNQAKLKSNLESTRPTPQKQLPTVIESKILSPAEKIDLSTLRVTSPTQVVLAAVPLTLSLNAAHHRTPEAVEKPKQGVVTQDDAIVSTNKPVNKKTIKQKTDQKDPTDVKSEANKPKRNWVRRVSKTEAISSRLSPKPAAEESAVDFINFLFETKSKFESETKVVDQDATTFLRSLFGDQVGLSPIKTDEPLQVESDSRVSEYPRKESLRQMTVEKEVEVQDETPKRKSQRGVVVIEKSVTEKEKHTSAVPTQQTPTIERTDGPSQLESDSNVSECTQKGSSYQMAVEQKVKLQDETKKGKSQRQVVITEPNQQSARKNEKHTTAAPKEQTLTHARIEKTPEKNSRSLSENVITNPATSVSEIVKDSPEKTEKNATAALKGQTLTKASEKNSRSLSENVSTNAATSVLEIVKDSPNKTEKNAPAAPKEQTPAPARIEKTPEKNSRSLSENVSSNPATPVPEIVKDSPKKTEKNATAALKGQTLTKASEKNSRSLSENVSTNPAPSVLEIVKDSPNKTEKNASAALKEQTPALARIEKTPEKKSRSLSENASTNPATSVPEIVKDSPKKTEKNATAALKGQTLTKASEKNSRSLSENVSTNPATSVPEIVKHSPTKIEKNVTATSTERSPAVVESEPKKVPEIVSVSDSTKKVGEGEKVVNEATRKSLGNKEEDTSEVQNKESSDSSSTTAHKPADPKSIAKLTTNKFIDSNLQEEGNLQDSKGKVAQDTSIVQTKLEETSSSSPSTTNTRRKSKKSVPVIVAKLSRSRKPPVAVNPKKLTPTSSEPNVSKDTSIPSSSKEETARPSVNELKKLDKVISNKSPQKGGDIEELSQTQKKPLSASEEEKATPENGAKEKSTPNRSGTSKTRNSVSESKLETPDDMAKTEKMIVSQSSESVSKNSTYTTKPPEEPPLLSKTTEPAAEDGTVELNANAFGDLTQHRSIETKIDTELVKELPQVSRLESVIAEDSAVQSNIMTSVILPQQEINTKSDNTRSHDTDTPTKAVDAVLSTDMPLPICQQQQATTDTSSNTKPVEEIRGPSIPEDHLSSVKTTEHVEKPSGQDSTKSAEQTNVDTSSDTKVVESSQATLLGGTEIKQSRHFVITEMSAVETDDQLQQEAIHPSDIKPVEELSKTKTKPSRRSTSEKANEIKEKLTVEADATQPVSINSAQQTIADTSSGTKTVESSQASLLEDIGMTHSCRSVTPEKFNVQSDDQQDTSDTKPVEELSKSKVKPRETKSSRCSISAKANEIKEQLPVTDDATQSNGLALTNPTQERTNDGTDAQPSLLDGTETKRSRRSLSKKTNEIVENLIKADSKTQSKEIAPENSSQQQVTTNKSDATPKADTTKHSHSIKISDSPDEVGKTDETVNIVSSSNEEPSRKEPNKRETGTQSSAKCDELQISDNLESTTQSEESKPNVSTKKSLRSVSVGKSETIEPVGIEAKLISGETIDKSLEENSTNPSNQQNNDAASDDNRVEQPSQELNRSRRSRRSTPVVLKIPPSSGMNKKKEQPSALSVKAIAEETKTRALASDLVSENSEDIENVKSTDVQVKAEGSTNVSEALKECSTPIESLTQHQNIEITSKSVELLVSERASEESESVVKSTKKTRTKPKPILTTERKGSSKKAAITDGRPIKEEPPKKTEKLPKEISQKVESKENGSKSLQSTDASSTSNIGKLSNKTETLPTDLSPSPQNSDKSIETKSSSKIEVCKPTTAAIQKTDDDPEAVNPDETPKGSKTTKGRKKRAKPKLNLSTSEEASKASSFSKESKLLPIDSQVNPSTDEPTSKTPQTIKGKKNVEAFSAELTATEDISQISDYSDGFEDCDIKDLIDVSIAAEKTLENQSNKPVSLFDAIKENPPKQGKAKNPFRKAKPSSKAEQKPAEGKATEADFLGFNEKEIEEGLKSTSLRLSQSTENLLVSPSTSYNKKKGSPRVKKSPLSAGKKQKQEQQAWKKNSAATLKSWLKTSDSSPEPVKEDNQETQPSTPKPKTAAPSKKRGTKQKDLKSSVEVNTAQGTEEDVVKTVEVKQTSDETPNRKRRLKTSVKLSDEMTCKTPSSRSKKGNEKSPSSTTKSKPKGAKDKEAVIKNEPNESTPIKPKKGSRKRPAPEPFTPGTEPPTKITHLSDEDIPIPIFTLPSAKSRGRQSKPSYKPVIPVNPLERKHKNDIEFNPRLLLVRKKEEFKSDEPLVDPDLQTVPKNASDVQCALCLGYTSKKNWIRHLSTHYGVGWVMGNPPTVNIKSRCSVLNYMIEFFKSSGVKGLECRICKGLRRSALGLLTHIEQCVLTEKEIEESRVVCEFCKNNYSRMSIPSHMRTCSAKPDPTREAKEPAESIHENDVLSNTGRVKRKSVIKAENNFRGMNDIEFIPEEFIKFIPQPEISLTNWQRDIQTFGKGFCIWKQCSFTAETIEELQTHCVHGVCPFYTNAIYKCIKCKYRSENNEAALNHVKSKHNPNPIKDFEGSSDDAPIESESSSSDSGSSGVDESETSEGTDVDREDGARSPKRKKGKKHKTKKRSIKRPKKVSTKDFKKLLPERSPKIASKVAKWYCSFLKDNYTVDALFISATPKIVQTNDDGYGPYFPKSALSMKFRLRGFSGFVGQFGKANIQPDQWQQLERFKGKGLPNEHILFVGGPVKRVAWAPLEPHPASSTQYLAISTRKDIEKYTRFLHPKLSRSLIYIQKYDISDSMELRGEIQYALAIDAGPVHCIEFMPSGGYAPNINRLGLLVVGTVETEIKVYSLPLKVAKKDCDMFPIVRLEPSFVLALEVIDNPNENMDNYQTQCVDLVWSQASGHSYIIGGFLNGFVGIWDISDEEDNLNRFCQNGITKFVPVSYFWTMESRIKYMAAHYDMNGLRWLLVCNETRKLLLFDLREINKPILFYVETMRNICTGIDWPVVWENPSCSLGDASPSYGCCINTTSLLNLVYNSRRLDKFCCGASGLHFNPWKNLYVGGAENGDLQITTIREANLDISLRNKYDQKVVTSMDVARFDSEDISNQAIQQKLQDGYRLFEHDYKEKYGLIFGAPAKVKGMKAQKLYDPKRIVSINLSRLMRINCLRFNPNRNANNILAVGYNNGFLRILQSDWAKMLDESTSN